ncbi:MAG: acyl-CoA dehydrogenase C-terminal domain-containing protein [Gammaproteobacteria bacterium]|nr:acyl-CoA dehydrogenase C-terminal domain-containing protein [Gammaproteobacteria bacterium]
MLSYSPPVDDMAFVLFDVFDAEAEWARMPAFGNVDRSLALAVLREAAKLASEAMAPLYQSADAEGAHWDDGAVRAPRGFNDAFRALAEGGWFGVSGNPEFGGQGLPKALTGLVEEMFWAANSNLYLYGALTTGAATCINAHADPDAKAHYLPSLYAGKWTGAMALTEAHAGTDLGLMRTRAVPDGQHYALTGTKVFITSGEHDLAENIVHLVLAKLPDAPAGTGGISLFIVPKFLPGGGRNRFSSGSIEHKMGIRGSATSVINYDGATGYLIGEPHKGLRCMFTMMNHARVSVGIQGLGLADLAYQNAAIYAHERLQGRAPTGPMNPDAAADSILVHPDVRRMLLTQRAFAEGGRAFAALVGLLLDQAESAEEPADRQAAQQLVDLLTPVVKAFLTDRGTEGALLAQQVFGGHGYIVDHGMEQIVRDVRITQIYEGANGIQALDFAGRKVLRDGAQTLRLFLDRCRADDVPEEFQEPLGTALDTIERVARYLLASAGKNPDLPGASSADLLELTGLGIYAWLWAKMAGAASRGDHGASKLAVARFFYAKLLPKTQALAQNIVNGADPVMALPESQF